MKTLLCIVASMDTGGAETFLMKIYRTIDREKYQMDFCVNSDKNYYAKEIEHLGGHIYCIPLKSKHPFKSFVSLKNLVRNKQYSYVIRINEHSLSTLDLIAAYFGGAKNLIMRSANAGSDGKLNTLLHKMFFLLPQIVPTVKLAPSTKAAIYTFGKRQVKKGNVKILHNGIDTKIFTFDKLIRSQYREELLLNDSFVVGHIGRFSNQKNHRFLITVFNELIKVMPESKLLLIGVGETEDNIREQIRQLGIEDKVLFLGVRTDINNLLMAMDLFLFPSLYEGMPNAIIEAQATGLPCIISDSITKEADITGLVSFISLNRPYQDWVKQIVYYSKKETDRKQIISIIENKGYNIQECSKVFCNMVFNEIK